MQQGQPYKISFWALVAISAVDCAAHSMNSLGPFAVGALVKAGQVNTVQAGIWSSVEMLAYAAAMAGIAQYATRVRLRSVAIVAAAAVIIAQGVSAITHGLAGLLALRVLSGLGLGALNAVVNIGASRLGRPVFVLSFVMVVQTVVFSGASLVLPYVGQSAGPFGLFLALAAIVVFLLPVMWLLPNASNSVQSATGRGGWFSKQESAALLAVLCYTGGSLAVWPFTERIAASVGLSTASFGVLSACANIAGLGVCLAGVKLSRKAASMRMLAPAIFIAGLICIMQAAPLSKEVFGAAFLVNYAVWFFIYPALVGLTCLVDPSGRLAARSGGAWMLSQAATTLLAGFAGHSGSYIWIGVLSMVLCAVSSICTMLVKPHKAGATT